MDQATSDRNPTRFDIEKKEVLESWLQVEANKGAAGVDKITIAKLGSNLGKNLYVIWNRMCAGAYFPPAVKRVNIPKPDGRMRPLGIPTVADRVAQTVIKNRLEPILERIFHKDSYGCRPGKSAEQAVRITQKRCWKFHWGIDLDIKGYFDNIPHDLMMKALRKHTDDKLILFYCERWLKASVQMPDGTIEERTKGTPQGGVISPLLANLFLHCALDRWLELNHPGIKFARYVDDAVIHCENKAQAEYLLGEIGKRMAECGLELHPEKTKIFYCKDANRRGKHDVVSFDFLGFTSKPRDVLNHRGEIFLGFNPAISQKAITKIAEQLRAMKIHRKTGIELQDIAEMLNPKLRGWLNYYGAFHPSAVRRVLNYLVNRILVKWAKNKYKKLKGWRRAQGWISYIQGKYRHLFMHWPLLEERKDGAIRAV